MAEKRQVDITVGRDKYIFRCPKRQEYLLLEVIEDLVTDSRAPNFTSFEAGIVSCKLAELVNKDQYQNIDTLLGPNEFY